MKKIAIVCNYKLLPKRIGGMDYFFKLFNEELLLRGIKADWYFTGESMIDFYKDFKLILAKDISIEERFIQESNKNEYDIIITHFTELCSIFYKKIKEIQPQSYIIAVDHNPRPLEGYPVSIRLKKKVKGKLYSKYINRFIAVSKYSEKHLIKDFGSQIKSKIQIILNGIDIEKYHPKTDYHFKGKFIVASHLRKEKGIQYTDSILMESNEERMFRSFEYH